MRRTPPCWPFLFFLLRCVWRSFFGSFFMCTSSAIRSFRPLPSWASFCGLLLGLEACTQWDLRIARFLPSFFFICVHDLIVLFPPSPPSLPLSRCHQSTFSLRASLAFFFFRLTAHRRARCSFASFPSTPGAPDLLTPVLDFYRVFTRRGAFSSTHV